MNWMAWLHGLVGAAIAGAAAALVSVAVGDSWASIGRHAIVSAVIGAGLYLKQSPLPASSVEVKKTDVTTVDVVKKD